MQRGKAVVGGDITPRPHPLGLSTATTSVLWLCQGPELSSVGGASTLQHQLVWNALPVRSTSISPGQFRARLKTHLFNQAYNILWEHFVLRVYCTYLLTMMISFPYGHIYVTDNWTGLWKILYGPSVDGQYHGQCLLTGKFLFRPRCVTTVTVDVCAWLIVLSHALVICSRLLRLLIAA